MKKLLFLLILLSAFSFQLLPEECSAFFVGFGSVGGADNVVKQGQDAGVIPLTPGAGLPPAGPSGITNAETVWQKNIGGFIPRKIALDDTGNIYLTGVRGSMFFTVKCDSTGNTVWQETYLIGTQDMGEYIAVDKAGDVCITGEFNDGASLNYLVIKYSGVDGETLWQMVYDSGRPDWSTGIAVDDTGNVYVTGASRNAANNPDFFTMKYSGTDGDTIWMKTYDSGEWDVANAIKVDASGNLYVTGYSGNAEDYLTIKYNSDSPPGVVWQKKYDRAGNDDEAWDIAVDPSGNVYVTGWSRNIINNKEYFTIKYNSSGETVWQKACGYSGFEDVANGIAADNSGNAYVTGWSNSAGTSQYLTVRYNSNGDTAWQKAYLTGDYSQGWGIVVDASGYVYVTGYYAVGVSNTCQIIKYRQY